MFASSRQLGDGGAVGVDELCGLIEAIAARDVLPSVHHLPWRDFMFHGSCALELIEVPTAGDTAQQQARPGGRVVPPPKTDIPEAGLTNGRISGVEAVETVD